MLANEITISVDALNSGSAAAVTLEKRTADVNKSVYAFPTSTLQKPDTLTVARTFAKRNGSYLGNSRAVVKLSMPVDVQNADGSSVVAASILEVSASLPVGITPAQTKLLRQRLIAFLDNDAVAGDVYDNLEV